MHAMIADATQIVGDAAQRVLLSLSVKTSFVPSLNDLPLALEADGVPDLMIVNVTNNLTGWEITARLQRAGYQGRVLALVDGLTDPRIRSLAVTMVDDPAIRETLDGIRAGFVEVVGTAVRRSQETGRLRRDVDPEHVVALFGGLSFLGAFTCALHGDRELERLGPVAATLSRVLAP